MASTSRSARYAKWLSIPLGLVISAVLIWQASYAAFSDEQKIVGEIGAATLDVSIGDADRDTFTALNLVPGQSVEHVVTATYSGNVDADVSFYAEALPEGNLLAPHLNLTIVVTNGRVAGHPVPHTELFDGTLTEFVNGHKEGRTPFTSTAIDKDFATFKFIVELSPEAGNEIMGERVDITFVGEAQSRAN